MTKPVKAVIPLKKINIVEHPRWKKWATDGPAMDSAELSASEEMHTLDCDSLKQLLFPIFNSGSRRRYLTDAEEDAICENWKDEPELEELYLIIERVTRDAWYFAYTPDDSDIEDAIHEAQNRVSENASAAVEDHGLEDAFDALGVDVQNLTRRILNDHVFYQRKPGWYDRYLVLDLGRSVDIRDLAKAKFKFEGVPQKSVLAWRPPDALQEGLKEPLQYFLERLEADFISEFFDYLEATMEDSNPGDRVDFNKQWKHTLLFSTKEVNEVRKSIEKYLSNLPPEETEGNG